VAAGKEREEDDVPHRRCKQDEPEGEPSLGRGRGREVERKRVGGLERHDRYDRPDRAKFPRWFSARGRGSVRGAMTGKPTAYWDYIRVEELLSLQAGLGARDADLSNDEHLFIVVHQIDELWFKLIIRELVSVRDLFASDVVPEQTLASAVHSIRRMDTLLHLVAQHFALMETMTTRDYLAFRDKLTPASGFQSAQLREIEILLGLPDADRIPLGHEHTYLQALKASGQETAASRRVQARLVDRPTLLEAINEWLHRTPIQGSLANEEGDEERVRAFLDAYCATHANAVARGMGLARTAALTPADEKRLQERYEKETASARAFLFAEDSPAETRAHDSRIRAALVFIESYRELPLLTWPREVIDAIVSFEQAFVIFRQRHARMVERVIGRRIGTGGSSGVDYLDGTALKYRIFRDVWAVRTLLVQKSELPELENVGFYGFAGKSEPSR
jgi:tryptophan 2,3-dioxygenase